MYYDVIVLDVIFYKVQAYNSWSSKFWFKYPTELIWYHVIVQSLYEGILVFNKMNMFPHGLMC